MSQYPLFETIAVIDGKFQNLAFHQERVEKAFSDYFHQSCTFFLNQIDVPKLYSSGFYRCRIDYNEKTFEVHFYDYTPREIHQFQCVYTENLDYTFKYTDRKRLEILKNLKTDEVIIINNGFVSDCTIGNLLFLKKEKWYSSNHYLLKGTQLSRLLLEGKIELVDIRAEQLFDYEKVMMINALNPFNEERAISITSGSILR